MKSYQHLFLNRAGLIALTLATLFAATSAMATVSDDLENLGSNQDVNSRADSLDSRTRIGIVQNRTVSRNWRLEIGGVFEPVTGGDTYLQTYNAGINADLHINSHFSLGVHYAKAFNSLTAEGQSQYNQAAAAQAAGSTNYSIPDTDPPQSTLMGVVDWYMTYGKINFFDVSVVQFDIYSLAGYGQETLASGTTPAWTGGLGIAFWLSQHITSRFEVRYENYQDEVYTGSRNLNMIIGTFGLGVLL
jgi:outer membrane beta-barrel protein